MENNNVENQIDNNKQINIEENKTENNNNIDNNVEKDKSSKIIKLLYHFSPIILVIINIILLFYITDNLSTYHSCNCHDYFYYSSLTEQPAQPICPLSLENLLSNARFALIISILINIGVLYLNIKRKSKIDIVSTMVASVFYFLLVFMFFSAYNDPNCKNVAMKPILYLYPEEEMNITVNFDKEELLTTTYPKFNNEWNVLVKPDGSIYEKGNYYYALYWEEKRIDNCKFEDGFYVEKDNAIKFLEEKLTTIGLNDKERNEFIMYWLPKLEDNGKSIVHFDLTDKLQKENEMIINPKPDSILRVHINIKKVNNKTNIKEQKLPTFKRSGYTAIEWGGTIY